MAYPQSVRGVLAHNQAFVEKSRAAAAERPATGRPALGLAVVACMDARLARMLPEALGLDDGDAVFVQVAGASVREPYGEAMRSLLVAVGELGVTDVMVVGHTDCGTCGMRAEHLADALVAAGCDRARLEAELAREPRAASTLEGFARLEDEVARSVAAVRAHPLMPDAVRVWGFTIDVATGALTPVDC